MTWHGPQYPGAMRTHRETKRTEAILRAKRAQARRAVEAAQKEEA